MLFALLFMFLWLICVSYVFTCFHGVPGNHGGAGDPDQKPGRKPRQGPGQQIVPNILGR